MKLFTRQLQIYWVSLLTLLLAQPLWAAETGSLSGQVLTKGTKKPISGANLFLIPTGETTLSDENGNFLFSNLPVGQHTLVAVAINHKKPSPLPVEISSEQEVTLTLYIEREPIAMLEIVVETEKNEPEISQKNLRQDEMLKIPGGNQNLMDAPMNLPGVAVGNSAGQDGLLVRGSGPQDNLVTLDEMLVIGAFHNFGFFGTVGTDFVKSIDFYSGGFGARYGNAMGSALNITSREIQTDRVATRLDLGVALSGGRIEGPIGEKGGFYLAARRGLFEYLPLSTDTVTLTPALNDYQTKFSYKISDRHHLSFLAFGSHDKFIFKTNDPDLRDPSFTGFTNAIAFHTQGVSLRSRDPASQIDSTFTLFNIYLDQSFTIGSDFLNIVFDQVRIKEDLVYDTPAHTLSTGLEIGYGDFKVDSFFIRPCAEGDPTCNITDAERVRGNVNDTGYGGTLYLEDTLHLSPRFDFTPGGRIDYFDLTNALDISPRLAARFDLNDRQEIRAAYGHYSQWPDRNGEFIEEFGTPGIKSQRAIHYILGYTHQLRPALELDIQTYYKELDHLIVPSDELDVIYDNDGEGKTKGIELFLRRRLTDRFFGWVAYGYSESRRRNHTSEAFRISDFDRPHTVNLVGSYQGKGAWSFSGRFRFISGAPFTPVVDTTLDTTTPDRLSPIYGETNARHLPASHFLDIRIEEKKVYNTWTMIVYYEILNVYNRKNALAVSYSDDFKTEEFVRLPGIIPNFGVIIEF